jgi:uncharacterized protein YlzI (FlbEa/FlbD family)
MERSKVQFLPQEIRRELDQRLLEGAFSNYSQLEEWLAERCGELGIEEDKIPSRASIHRYGSKLQKNLEAIRASTEAAKALAAGSPDDEGDLNEATTRLAQSRLFDLLMDNEDVDQETIGKIARAAADITRASLSQKKYKMQVREKTQEVASKVDAYKRSGGLSAEVADEIRKQILGIAS